MSDVKLVSYEETAENASLAFENTDISSVADAVGYFFAAEGYMLEGGTKENGVYGKGNKVANAFLGPLASRYKWSVAVFPESENVRVKVSKSMTGRWGGALGARKVKKELNRLAVKMKALPSEFMH